MTTPFAAESARCQAAQRSWEPLPVRERLRPVREFRFLLTEHVDALTAAATADVGRAADEFVATDVLTTAAACRFLQRHAERVLRPRRVGGRPLWLAGCRDVVHRRPHGVVGVIGTWNYPLFLNAVPILHALTAGNGVLWKPSEHTPRFAGLLGELLDKAGFPPDLVTVLPATRDGGPQLAEADVDFVHFTGSDAVGRKLAARLGERLVPSVLELSGVDALIVCADADVRLAARAAWYGATLNGGQTCMATRRVFVDERVFDRFVAELTPLVRAAAPVRLVSAGQAVQAGRLVGEAKAAGCEVVRADMPAGPGEVPPTALVGRDPAHGTDLTICREASFAPIVSVTPFATTDQAVSMHNGSPFGLAAAVFTADLAAGADLAGRLRCGAVVVNDVIVPTAHPGTPFGGRGASGWGVTQGDEGLLAMTVPQVVTVRRGSFRPHVDAALTGDPAAGDVARGLLRLGHGRTVGERWRGLRQLARGMLATGKAGRR